MRRLQRGCLSRRSLVPFLLGAILMQSLAMVNWCSLGVNQLCNVREPIGDLEKVALIAACVFGVVILLQLGSRVGKIFNCS